MSLNSIRTNMLRSIITILIIAFGITALVGILTAIDAIKFSLTSNFSQMGSNTFTIENRTMAVQGRGQRYEKFKYEEAVSFKEQFVFPADVSIHTWFTNTGIIKFRSEKTNPNIAIQGVDEVYLPSSGYNLETGRNFSKNEIQYGTNVVIIGSNINELLFGNSFRAIGNHVLIGNIKYLVIGTLKEKGSSFGFTGDNTAFIPLTNARKNSNRELNYSISVNVHDPEQIDAAMEEATQLFRIIRKIPPGKENNFEISKSNSLAQMLIENIQYVTMAATLIGLITLIGAAIGLMNIMMVTVTERTKEIGTRKAIGASPTRIRNQFLIESVIIGQMGGILGIIFGILVGNIFSLIIGSPFVIPWGWIIFGVLLCFVVGIVSGLYPATKASKLDPVEALRYE